MIKVIVTTTGSHCYNNEIVPKVSSFNYICDDKSLPAVEVACLQTWENYLANIYQNAKSLP